MNGKSERPRAVVLRAAGTNCDRETVAALRLAGAAASDLHVNALGDAPQLLDGVGLLVFPGGFTFGDDVASGAVLAHAIECRLKARLQDFLARGGLMLGICNGFQVLVRLGFLPGGGKGEGALLVNRSGRFEDRWVYLRAASEPSPWFEAGTIYRMPVAHAEGRFAWFPIVDGDPFPREQIAFCYCDGSGGDCRYPEDPNGSHQQIAGVLSPDGNVLGMMPHPERFLRAEHHPSWMRMRRADGTIPREEDLPQPLGLDIFRRAVAHLRQRVATESR